MFIAMNRFRVAKGSEAAFEQVWMSRDSHLDKVPGFIEFHLLKGSEAEDHALYASHTVWENHAVFEAWTKSGVPGSAQSGRDSRCIWIAPGSRGLMCFRRWGTTLAGPQPLRGKVKSLVRLRLSRASLPSTYDRPYWL
jgi:heme-degrading monooxygenase HmoA